ncbi:hypothetical protein HID58_076248, partial [Brassica napus]
VQNYKKAPIFYTTSLITTSRSDQQLLHGQEYTHTSACKLEESSNGLPVVPCGLIAWSMLYDTNFSRERTKLKVSRNDTAWKSDHEHKFRKNVFPFNFQNGTLISGPKLDPKVTVCILNHYYHRYQ